MKKWISLTVVLFFLTFFIVIKETLSKIPTPLFSPVLKNQKVLGMNQWFPEVVSNELNAPMISAMAAMFIDTKSGKVLYSKNIHEKLPIASLVKVMTVLVALEYKSIDDKFTVSQRAADMEPDKMLLIANEKLILKELLEGIFLVSANDAAEVIAEGTTGDRSEFVKLMNDKAEQL